MPTKSTPEAKAFSDRLAHVLMIEQGLAIESTGTMIAGDTGISTSTLYNWRSGSSRPGPENLGRLCEKRRWSCLHWLASGKREAPTAASLINGGPAAAHARRVECQDNLDLDLRQVRSGLLVRLRAGLETTLRPPRYEPQPPSFAVAVDRLVDRPIRGAAFFMTRVSHRAELLPEEQAQQQTPRGKGLVRGGSRTLRQLREELAPCESDGLGSESPAPE